MAATCSISGEATDNAVVITKTGYVFDKTLLDKFPEMKESVHVAISYFSSFICSRGHEGPKFYSCFSNNIARPMIMQPVQNLEITNSVDFTSLIILHGDLKPQ